MEGHHETMEKRITLFSFIFSDTFLVSLFLYCAAVRIDLSFEGFISRAFNPTIMLLIVILSGLGSVLCWSPAHEHNARKAPRRLWFYTGLISLFIGSIVFEVLKSISSWALLLSVAAGAIVFLASSAMIREYGND